MPVIDSWLMKKIGILFHPKIPKSEQFALDLKRQFKEQDIECWLHSSWDESGARLPLRNSDLIVSIGGDGTILRAARIVFPLEIPIVGINFGNLGFMTEMGAEDVSEKLSAIISGKGWLDERVMLQAKVKSSGKSYHALNDVVVGRGKFVRLINIEVYIDGEMFTTYRADAVIISTATGSTSYSLAADGPILYPGSRDIIIKAVCPHLNMDKALVVAGSSKIKLRTLTKHQAVVSMDGQVEQPLEDGDEVTVSLSEHVTRFIRLREPNAFYTTLVSKLKGKLS
jgi:NAD+ kinase